MVRASSMALAKSKNAILSSGQLLSSDSICSVLNGSRPAGHSSRSVITISGAGGIAARLKYGYRPVGSWYLLSLLKISCGVYMVGLSGN